MFPIINIGPLAFPSVGLVVIFGAYFCLTVVEKAAIRLQQNHVEVYSLATTGLVAGFVGARLAFVVEYWAAFRENLLGIVWPLNTGYNFWAGLIIGVAAMFFHGRFKQLPPIQTLDALSPALIFGLMVVSLADFLGGPGLGTMTSVPWGMSQFGIRRHAVQIYELMVGAAALLLWWQLSKQPRKAGILFLGVTAVYTTGRLFFDAYRANTPLTTNGYHIIQITMLIILITSLFFLGLISPASSDKTSEDPR